MTKSRKASVPPHHAARKRVTVASSDEIDRYSDVATRFMQDVFEFEPGDYVIADESTLRDFTFLGISDTTPAWARIEELYGLSRIGVGSEDLLHIFAAIERGRSAH